MEADREPEPAIPRMVNGVFIRCPVCTALARNRRNRRKVVWGPARRCDRCRRFLAPDAGPPAPRLWPLDGPV